MLDRLIDRIADRVVEKLAAAKLPAFDRFETHVRYPQPAVMSSWPPIPPITTR